MCIRDRVAEVVDSYEKNMEEMLFSAALSDIWRLLGRGNKYIDETMPWVLAKEEENLPRLRAVLYNLCEILRVVAILIQPVMDKTAKEIFIQLGIYENEQFTSYGSARTFGVCGGFNVNKTINLFPRIDLEKEDVYKRQVPERLRQPENAKGPIERSDAGSVTEVIPAQPSKADSSI